jgi:hypothetical protein|eukprot:COSAG06_NODE_2450_length_6860_cov_8.295814_2_plen_363_part_00
MRCSKRPSGSTAALQLAQAVDARRTAYIKAHPGSSELDLGGRLGVAAARGHYLALGVPLPPNLPPVRAARERTDVGYSSGGGGGSSSSNSSSFRATRLGMARLRLAFAHCMSCRFSRSELGSSLSSPLQIRDTDVLEQVGLRLLHETTHSARLSFDEAGSGYDLSAECGALVRSVGTPECRLAQCAYSLPRDICSAAAFTVVRKGRWAVYIGLASRAADVEQPDCLNSPGFFGLGSGSGQLFHCGERVRWGGCEGFGLGDQLELLFDGRLGMLHVAKNGRLLGEVHQVGRPNQGCGLCWAVSASDAGWAVRIERVDPREFGGPVGGGQSVGSAPVDPTVTAPSVEFGGGGDDGDDGDDDDIC